MRKRTPTLRLVCWREDRAAELEAELEQAGFDVDASALDRAALRALGQAPPDAVVIDLGRLPAQGRDIGITLRTTARSRHTPLVFVNGAEDKVARTREVLPDATYASREGLAAAVLRSIDEPLADPVVPESNFAGYSGTPLPKKLGIKVGSTVALVDAPNDIEATLGDLPEKTAVVHEVTPKADVTLWFLGSLADLSNGIARMAGTCGNGRLWICWPKKASGITTDVNQNEVRSTGLATGLVDFKICAIDSTWSGLCFTRRKK
jgi:CheY-like chemotaxis protein